MTAYYNENDRNAATWLRELIKQGLIAPGDVDERSIVDVVPSELAGYTQCHFFAGIGVWSYALRSAGWGDNRAVWTDSCPCQPFSTAGKGGGFADERHLWPAFYYLISQCRPPVVFGEQVGSKDGLTWLDLVHTDMEAAGYAFGATDLCAAGFGAPHIRQRLYFVADTNGKSKRATSGENGQTTSSSSAIKLANTRSDEREQPTGIRPRPGETESGRAPSEPERRSDPSKLGDDDDDDTRLEGRRLLEADRIRSGGCELPAGAAGDYGGVDNPADPRRYNSGEHGSRPSLLATRPEQPSRNGGMEIPGGDGRNGREASTPGDIVDGQASAGAQGEHGSGIAGARRDSDAALRPTNGFWRDADWSACRDNKWRAVEPGSSPLAHGSAARVGRLRGYGNAIVAEVAKEFIQTYMTR